jgi:pantetheine-phosphate adenylyltransferase
MITVVYPGTFDPLTRGHEDLVRRAARVFDRVVVGVADSEAKNPFFPAAERIAMARDVLAPFDNVEVLGFSSLLMDFVRAQGAKIILRGLRAGLGLRVRVPDGGMNRHLYPGCRNAVPHALGAVHLRVRDDRPRDRQVRRRRLALRASARRGPHPRARRRTQRLTPWRS